MLTVLRSMIARGRLWFAHVRVGTIQKKTRHDVVVFADWSDVKMGCCDCGLIHRYSFKANEAGHLEVRARRLDGPTAAVRMIRPFPMARRIADVPMVDVHPADVRLPDDPKVRDRVNARLDARALELIGRAKDGDGAT